MRISFGRIAALALTAHFFVLAGSCLCQTPTTPPVAPGFNGQPPGEAQKVFRKVTGVVKAVDVKAMTITIQLPDGPRTFAVPDGTKFTRAGAKVSMNDIAVGATVDVTIVSSHRRANGAKGDADELSAIELKDH